MRQVQVCGRVLLLPTGLFNCHTLLCIWCAYLGMLRHAVRRIVPVGTSKCPSRMHTDEGELNSAHREHVGAKKLLRSRINVNGF